MAVLTDLLVFQLRDLLDAENQLTEALPTMASAAKNPLLKQAFEKHLVQTQGHVERLNQAFQLLGAKAQAKTCRAMQGLIQEGQETIAESKSLPGVASDVALVAAAQRVEHYEISGYGTARSLARLAGQREVAHLLEHTLGEEEAADYLLTMVSKPLLQEIATELYSTATAR